MIQLQLKISEKKRIQDVLTQHFDGISHSKLKKIYQQNRVLVNNFLIKKDNFVNSGDQVAILSKPFFINDIMIYYQDNSIIVVEKPSYTLSVDTDKTPGYSLHSTLKRRYGLVFPVHRLDRETSGVMVFALSRKAKDSLDSQFEKRTVEREYLSILEGCISCDNGTWNKPLEEGLDMKMYVKKSGKPSITRFSLISHINKRYSYIKCKLETGRKNQIRAHAASYGYPVLGDNRYGSAKKSKILYLHAHKLSFLHPEKDKIMSFISPIPYTFKKIVL